MLGGLLPTLGLAATWRIDTVHSQVWFTVDHQQFSFPQGRLHISEGWLRFDPDDWAASTLEVSVATGSVDLGDADWNQAVTSAQFLDAKRWPTAHFTARSVSQTNARQGVIHGELTLHGHTLPLDITFTLNRIARDPYTLPSREKAGFSARASLSRRAFGMRRFAEVVGDRVDLRIEVEAVRDRSAGTNQPPAAGPPGARSHAIEK